MKKGNGEKTEDEGGDEIVALLSWKFTHIVADRANSNNYAYTMKSHPPFCSFIKLLYL